LLRLSEIFQIFAWHLFIPSFSVREWGILFLGFYRQEGKMFKVGTVAELESLELKGKIPEEVYREALRVVAYLDETFGAERDVDFEDGGYVVIAENREDLECVARNHVELDSQTLEYVELVPAEKEPYLNAFFLVNEYESGVTLFLPMSIAPENFLREVEASLVHR
jgi:hypothetical protein